MTFEVNFQPVVESVQKNEELKKNQEVKKTVKVFGNDSSQTTTTTSQEVAQPISDKVEKKFPNYDIEKDSSLLAWREQTKDEPSRESQFAELKAQGKTSEESIEEMKKREVATIKNDTQYLRELFAKDPDARVKFQENFLQLSRREQKAVLNEAYTSGRKLEGEEISRLMQGLSSSSDEVKSLIVAQLRNDSRVTKEQMHVLEDRLNVAESKIVGRLPKMETLEAANVVDTVMGDKKSVCRAQVAETLPKCDKEVIPYAIKSFVNAETVKNDDVAKNAFIKSLSKYDDKNQVYASKMGLDSDNFNSKDRSGIIGQIKNFSNADSQKQVAEYAINSDKVDSDNRQHLAKEIKNLKPEIQKSVSDKFESNEKNVADAKVMKAYEEAKESEEKAIKEQVAQAEKASKQQSQASLKSVSAELQQIIKATNANPFNTTSNKVQKELPTYLTFANFINTGSLSVKTVTDKGYASALVSYFNDFSGNKQEEILNSLTKEQLLGMYSKNKLPERFKKFLLAKASQSTVDSTTARKIASSASANDVVSLFQCARTEKNKRVYKEALQKRFTDTYKDLFGEGQLA